MPATLSRAAIAHPTVVTLHTRTGETWRAVAMHQSSDDPMSSAKLYELPARRQTAKYFKHHQPRSPHAGTQHKPRSSGPVVASLMCGVSTILATADVRKLLVGTEERESCERLYYHCSTQPYQCERGITNAKRSGSIADTRLLGPVPWAMAMKSSCAMPTSQP
jgi:hypothetical protein